MISTNGNYTNNIQASTTGITITNNETISGAGTIQNTGFVNNGTVNANVSGFGLTLQSLTSPSNTATLEATNGGTLNFNGSSWTQTGRSVAHTSEFPSPD